MTELEEKFYKTFGIEPFIYCCKPRLDCSARSEGTCVKECEYYSGILYPEITAERLLKLVGAMNDFQGYTSLMNSNIEELKNEILEGSLFLYERLRKFPYQEGFKETIFVERVQKIFAEV